MLHLGKGYSKMLQSYNQDIFSPDASFRNTESDHDAPPLNIMRTLDKELDAKDFDISCQKLPHIRSSSNVKKFDH